MMRNEYVINPREYGRNNSLVVFLSVFELIWAAGSAFGLRKLIVDFSYVGLFFFILCIGVLFFIGWILLGMNRKQQIIVQDGSLVIKDSSFKKFERKVSRENLISAGVTVVPSEKRAFSSIV